MSPFGSSPSKKGHGRRKIIGPLLVWPSLSPMLICPIAADSFTDIRTRVFSLPSLRPEALQKPFGFGSQVRTVEVPTPVGWATAGFFIFSVWHNHCGTHYSNCWGTTQPQGPCSYWVLSLSDVIQLLLDFQSKLIQYIICIFVNVYSFCQLVPLENWNTNMQCTTNKICHHKYRT